MVKYKLISQVLSGKNREAVSWEFDTIKEARRFAISQIAKRKSYWIGNTRMDDASYTLYSSVKKNKWKNLELIQARNDGRNSFIVIVRGPGGNRSYTQILNANGEIVSPKISVYAMEHGWKYPWAYKYRK